MRGGREVAIATVVETWGSAPCPVGAQLVIDEEGNFEGSVSGGCVENEILVEAENTLKTGDPKLLEYGVSDEMAWQVGLGCGGTIKIYLERVG